MTQDVQDCRIEGGWGKKRCRKQDTDLMTFPDDDDDAGDVVDEEPQDTNLKC